MMFKLVEKESRDIMSVTTNMSPAEYEELARLGVGQAMLHFGKINSPLQIATYNVEEVAPIRKVISDSEIHELERYWVDPEHAKLLVPHRECKYNKYCGEQCDLCMKDDADYVATKIFQDFPEKIQEKKEFVRFLVSMNPEIIKILNNRPSMKKTKQMVNCVKIKYFRTNKFQNMFVNSLNIVAAIIIIASIALAFVTPYSLVATAVAGIFLGYRCYKAIKEYPKRVEAALNALIQTLTEIGDFRQYFEDNSKKKDAVLSETEFI